MLDWLGVMKDLEPQAVFTQNLILVDALTDRELTRISCGPEFRGHFGAPYTVVHRRDLHGALLEACRRREEITLHTSKELASFSEAAGRVLARFADAAEYEGAAMIGADGLRSRVREILIGDGAPRPIGHVSYRGVVPFDQVKDRSHFDDMVIWIGPNLHFVQYRLRGGTVMNNVATVASERFERGERSDYGGPGELPAAGSPTTPPVPGMAGYGGQDKDWERPDRPPPPRLTRG